jgi:hypothetical protein
MNTERLPTYVFKSVYEFTTIIKSIENIESWLTHGIVKNAMSLLIHKLLAKTESVLNLKSSMNTEWQLMYGMDSINEFTTDASNR